jgi:hypothetical protein
MKLLHIPSCVGEGSRRLPNVRERSAPAHPRPCSVTSDVTRRSIRDTVSQLSTTTSSVGPTYVKLPLHGVAGMWETHHRATVPDGRARRREETL